MAFKGFPDAINAVFPQTMFKLLSFHMGVIRLNTVSWKDLQGCHDWLKSGIVASTEEEALLELERFSDTGTSNIRKLVSQAKAHWQNLNYYFLIIPADIRKR